MKAEGKTNLAHAKNPDIPRTNGKNWKCRNKYKNVSGYDKGSANHHPTSFLKYGIEMGKVKGETYTIVSHNQSQNMNKCPTYNFCLYIVDPDMLETDHVKRKGKVTAIFKQQ